MTSTDVDVNGPEPDLQRVMGPKLLLLFIVGDILGAGIYAVTGEMALEVGGIVWVPFVVAFAVATLTALSYLELVTKFPQAAGAALYTHKAFGIHFVTFLVAFAVICSGITSASTAANLLGTNLLTGLDGLGVGGIDPDSSTAITGVAMGFMVLLALINLRGVGESVKFNVFLTLVEMLALVIVIVIGFVVISRGDGDLGRMVVFESGSERGLFLAVTVATAIAFFAMVGFEDSVNMVEETKDPERIFPRVMLTGLGIAVLFYVLVSISVVAVIPEGEIEKVIADEGKVLLNVVRTGAPGLPIDDVFPFLTVIAVANTALINMLMASRLLYGLANQDVLPRSLGKVLPGRRTPWVGILFSTVLALGLIVAVTFLADTSVISALSGTTALLLLCVFAVVNIACVVLRREPSGAFSAPTWAPYVGAVACLFFVGPWARDRDDWIQYQVAGGLVLLGIVLWAATWATNRGVRAKKTGFRDIEHLED
ncbi:amino acid permease [Nocardioides psychrotolerans]|uniref:Amino acid transporter n=1 Tax=Nocardioides psychrotolerans TaxID=1005945 RepID=A0A1I3D8P4_9ACTN|nr:APC family permease [Nocardioides psychrotolerans]GEP37087.1 amino acid permease [Nocardioides psychrotolerans]SFH83092.1 Amino acid transporter [Nocardioides psychrotolerans]